MSTQYLEIPATLFGLLNVYLAARANIWNWLFGVLTVSLYLIIFFYVKLYADMGLQVVFLILQFYGCYEWLYGGEQQSALTVRTANFNIYLIVLLATALLFFAITYLLRTYTDSTTIYIDALTTALSLVAQWMLSKKWIENWLVWILVDIIAIFMYIQKSLYLTSGLYFVFLLICIMGFYTWRKQDLKNTMTILKSA